MAIALAQIYNRHQYSVRFRRIPTTQRNIETALSGVLLYNEYYRMYYILRPFETEVFRTPNDLLILIPQEYY